MVIGGNNDSDDQKGNCMICKKWSITPAYMLHLCVICRSLWPTYLHYIFFCSVLSVCEVYWPSFSMDRIVITWCWSMVLYQFWAFWPTHFYVIELVLAVLQNDQWMSYNKIYNDQFALQLKMFFSMYWFDKLSSFGSQSGSGYMDLGFICFEVCFSTFNNRCIKN